jgi:hypothetical protein
MVSDNSALSENKEIFKALVSNDYNRVNPKQTSKAAAVK